jgi:sec-independent protein translocase protein TatA
MGIDNPVHLIFIAAVALIVLGPKRLPELARSLGHGMREFRNSMSEAVKDDGPVSGALVPEQAQLVAAPEPVAATPVDAVIVDPAAPERPVVGVHEAVPIVEQATPAQAAVPPTEQASTPAPAPRPAPSVATEAVTQPAPPPAA